MKVNNYPVKTPAAGDRLFGSDSNGDQKQFDITNFTNAVFQYEVGEYVEDQGGVIFHRYLDGDTQNYLVVGLSNLSTSQVWSNVASTLIGSTAQSTWDGLSNSNAIVSQVGQTSSAAKLCLDSTANSKTDWYLPAIQELNLLWTNRFDIDKSISSIVGSSAMGVDTFWSSTETTSTFATTFNLQYGTSLKNVSNYVRAIRKFSI